ncbi:zinc finger protein 185 [Gastrophryne carolinensis]
MILGTGATEDDRQNILRQMKVRTKFKTDSSWIQRQGSEDEHDSVTSPKSPQLKSLEGRKLLWSPNPDSQPEKDSGVISAKETLKSTSSLPVQSSNSRQFSYRTTESNTPPTSPSKSSPPPSTTGSRPASSYIIRGQPLNSVSQVKSPPSYNGYQKSTVQNRTSSLPRIQTAAGFKMSTEEYKKLAPYNVRNSSADLSDEENPFTSQEQVKRTEQASSVLRNTSSKERSYVISAARNSGTVTHDSVTPFVAKRVEIQEEISPERKSQSLPRSLDTYLYEDATRFENSWKEAQSKQTPSQTSPPRCIMNCNNEEAERASTPTTNIHTTTTASATERSSSPRLSYYTVNANISGRSSPVKPEAGSITVIREERVEVTESKNETPKKSLESYLFEDASRFEKDWIANQANLAALLMTPPRVTDRSESPTLIPRSTEKRVSPVKPEPGKITVLTGESDKIAPKTTEVRSSSRTVTTTVESDSGDIPKLTSFKDNTEAGSSTMQTGPGKITVLKEESNRESPKVTTQNSSTTTTTRTVEPSNIESNKESSDIPKLISCSIFETPNANPEPLIQTGPGKITLVREDSAEDTMPDTTFTTTRTTTSTESRSESTPPKPVPRMEPKPKETVSSKQGDLISWSDLDDVNVNRFTAPQPSVNDTRYRVSEYLDDPEPSSNLISSQPQNSNVRIKIETLPEPSSTSEPPKAERSSSPRISDAQNSNVRIKIETLSEPSSTPEPPRTERSSSPRISDAQNSNVRIKIETLSELSSTPEPPRTETSSSPRPSPRSRESTTTTSITETRYGVPETLEDTMLASSPASSRTTVTTTRSTDPVYTEYLEDGDTRSTRTVSSSREKTTTTTTTVETRYDHASWDDSQYDPQSPGNKGILFLKEYVNTSENLKSPNTAGHRPDFSGDSETLSYSTNSSYLYSSAPRRSDEGPCTYCGREIKDCAKIILEHLNIYCHEYCFKCGICNKPMGDLIDSLFIHRDVVHCESCYEKLF